MISLAKMRSVNHMLGMPSPHSRSQAMIGPNFLWQNLPRLERLARVTFAPEILLALIERYAEQTKYGVGRRIIAAVMANPVTQKAIDNPKTGVAKQILMALHASGWLNKTGLGTA